MIRELVLVTSMLLSTQVAYGHSDFDLFRGIKANNTNIYSPIFVIPQVDSTGEAEDHEHGPRNLLFILPEGIPGSADTSNDSFLRFKNMWSSKVSLERLYEKEE